MKVRKLSESYGFFFRELWLRTILLETHLKMDGWNTNFRLGPPAYCQWLLLLVSRRVYETPRMSRYFSLSCPTPHWAEGKARGGTPVTVSQVGKKLAKPLLVGGWTNPSEKYARQIGWFPQVGVKIPKNIRKPHLLRYPGEWGPRVSKWVLTRL